MGLLVVEQESLWESVVRVLREQLNEAVWFSTFADAVPVDCDDMRFVLQVPNSLARERIQSRYLQLVNEALAEVGHPELELEVVIAPEDTEVDAPRLEHTDAEISIVVGSERDAAADAGLNPRYGFDTFVKGASNQFALAAAQRVAETPARSYNPLFVYGSAGLGKTHLLHAIGHYVLHHYRHYVVRYVSTESFMNEYVDAIRSNSMAGLRRRYREVDVLLIDDVQFLEGKEGLQEEFFHTFNSLHGANKQIVLSSDQPPSEIAQLEQRLVSRFEWGLTAELQPPDMETRLAILRKKAAGLDVNLPNHVLEYLAHRVKSNVRRLEGALLRVASFSSLSGRPLTDDSVEHVLRDILQEEARRAVSIDQVQRKVAEHYDVRLADMTSKRRPANIAFPRQIAMFISRRLTKSSLQDIGEAFGGRDHGTVIHACKTVQDRMDKEESLRQIIRFLETALQR